MSFLSKLGDSLKGGNGMLSIMPTPFMGGGGGGSSGGGGGGMPNPMSMLGGGGMPNPMSMFGGGGGGGGMVGGMPNPMSMFGGGGGGGMMGGMPNPMSMFGGGGGGFSDPISMMFGGGSDSGVNLYNQLTNSAMFGSLEEAARKVKEDPWSPESMALLQMIGSYNQRDYGPWSQQAPYLTQGFQSAADLMGQQGYNNANMQRAQQGILDVANNSKPLMDLYGNVGQGAAANSMTAQNTGLNTAQFLTNPNLLYANSNPYLQSYMDAANRGAVDQYTKSVLPNIRGEANITAPSGTTRQGIAEGNATNALMQSIGDTNSKIASQGYGQGLDSMNKALYTLPALANSGSTLMGAAPQAGSNMLNFQAQPWNMIGSVGQQQWQNPWADLGNYMKNVGGANWGSSGQAFVTDPGYKVSESINKQIQSWLGPIFGGIGAGGGGGGGGGLSSSYVSNGGNWATYNNPGWGSGAFDYAPD